MTESIYRHGKGNDATSEQSQSADLLSQTLTPNRQLLMDPASLAAPHYQRCFGVAEGLAAIDQLFAVARREIRLFDVSLTGRGFNTLARNAALEQFLQGGRDCKLRIVLHEIQQVEAELPRLIELMRQFSTQITINRTREPIRSIADPLYLADDHSFWHHLHFEQPRSVLQLNDAAETAPWAKRFEEIWEDSDFGVTATTLGL